MDPTQHHTLGLLLWSGRREGSEGADYFKYVAVNFVIVLVLHCSACDWLKNLAPKNQNQNQ